MRRNPELVMRQYRRYIMSCKKKWGSARGLIHYSEIIQAYLECKRSYLRSLENSQGSRS